MLLLMLLLLVVVVQKLLQQWWSLRLLLGKVQLGAALPCLGQQVQWHAQQASHDCVDCCLSMELLQLLLLQ